MIHPHTELQFISKEKGFGVVATQDIPKGTITWVQDKFDQVISITDYETSSKQYQDIMDYFTFRDREGNYILCWDLGKYVNHSFKSNCMTTPYNFEIAIRDIKKGEELTDDYGYLNVDHPFEAMDENSSRKVVYPDDILSFHQEWDALIVEGMSQYDKVKQPMENLLSDEVRTKVNNILSGKSEMDSILNCYYEPINTNHASKK